MTRSWVPELEHVLRDAELFPFTRLITGVRFAAAAFAVEAASVTAAAGALG